MQSLKKETIYEDKYLRFKRDKKAVHSWTGVHFCFTLDGPTTIIKFTIFFSNSQLQSSNQKLIAWKKKYIVCQKVLTKICFKKDILIQICFGKNFQTIKTKIVFNTRIQDLLLSSIFLRSKFLEKQGCLISLTGTTLPLLAKSRSDSAKRQEIKFSH